MPYTESRMQDNARLGNSIASLGQALSGTSPQIQNAQLARQHADYYNAQTSQIQQKQYAQNRVIELLKNATRVDPRTGRANIDPNIAGELMGYSEILSPGDPKKWLDTLNDLSNRVLAQTYKMQEKMAEPMVAGSSPIGASLPEGFGQNFDPSSGMPVQPKSLGEVLSKTGMEQSTQQSDPTSISQALPRGNNGFAAPSKKPLQSGDKDKLSHAIKALSLIDNLERDVTENKNSFDPISRTKATLSHIPMVGDWWYRNMPTMLGGANLTDQHINGEINANTMEAINQIAGVRGESSPTVNARMSTMKPNMDSSYENNINRIHGMRQSVAGDIQGIKSANQDNYELPKDFPDVDALKDNKFLKTSRSVDPNLSGGSPSVTVPSSVQSGINHVKISGDDDYNKLPSGTSFVGPDGIARRKP